MRFRVGVMVALVFGICPIGAGSAGAMAVSSSSETAGAAGLVGTTAGAGESADSVSEQANAAWEAKDWERSAKLYEELSKEKDAPPRVWLRLGGSLRALGKYDQRSEEHT